MSTATRQVQILITENLYEAMKAECGRCDCQMPHFIRHAIAKELLYRAQVRAAGAGSFEPAPIGKPDNVS